MHSRTARALVAVACGLALLLWRGSTIDRFPTDVRDAAVQVVPQ